MTPNSIGPSQKADKHEKIKPLSAANKNQINLQIEQDEDNQSQNQKIDQ